MQSAGAQRQMQHERAEAETPKLLQKVAHIKWKVGHKPHHDCKTKSPNLQQWPTNGNRSAIFMRQAPATADAHAAWEDLHRW